MLDIRALTLGYGNSPVLQNLHLSCAPNAVHGIVGLNGAGKSTLFNAVAGRLKPEAGEITLGGKPLKRTDAGYLETTNFFYSKITGAEYLNLFEATNSGFQLEGLQQLFNLPLHQFAESYSTGMKKKLALLAILKQDRPVYIFDEPFNGLDLETNKVLEAIIHRLKQKGKLVLVSSHILEPLLLTCDYIHYLAGGVVQKSFGPEEFASIDQELFTSLRQRAEQVVARAL